MRAFVLTKVSLNRAAEIPKPFLKKRAASSVVKMATFETSFHSEESFPAFSRYILVSRRRRRRANFMLD